MRDEETAKERALRAFHVVPAHDIKEHEQSRLCWCRPTLASFEDGEEVWSHHGFADEYFSDKNIH